MELYKLKTENATVGIYARNKEDIVDLVTYYYEQTKKEGQLNDPNIANWAKRIPSRDEITKVERGFIRYHVGMIYLSNKDEPLFSIILPVSDDFEVYVTPEALFYFDQHRQILPNCKRKELYKFQIDHPLGGLYFVPDDIMKAIASHDLTPHIERARTARSSMEKVISGHPNLGSELKLK